VVAKCRERLAVSKETTEKLDMERFSPRKLNKVDGKEWHWFQIKKGSQVWNAWMMIVMWISVELGKLLKRM
jgi:hypothetical protein